MRRLSRAIITGSLAFSLVAAAAAGTAFTVNTVEGIAVASAAADTIDTEPCTGAYDITWQTTAGLITGFDAERIPTSTTSDPGLQYCTDMPYALIVVTALDEFEDAGGAALTFDVDGTPTNVFDNDGKLADGIPIAMIRDALDNTPSASPTISLQWFGNTEGVGSDAGDIESGTIAPANANLVLEKGHQVILVIGPGAVDLYPLSG